MNKSNFLNGLKEALNGELSPSEINEQLLYYERYIEEEMKKGKSEAQVVETLGEPRLIARTIIETSSTKSSYGEAYYEESQTEREERPTNGKIHNFQLNGILIVVAVVLIIVVVLSVIFSLVTALAPILVPVILILLVISYFKKKQ